MSRSAALARLGEIAQAQWGLVTARQASTVEVTQPELSRLAADGAVERVAFGVYHMAGVPLPRLLELRVAWLQLQPGVKAEMREPACGVVSHTSAAAMYEVGDLDAERHEFTVPIRRRTRRSDVVLHVAPLPNREVTWVDQLPVASPPRLVADLLRDHHDGEHVARVAADCIHHRLAAEPELAAVAAPYAAAYGFPPREAEGFLAHLTARIAPAGHAEASW